MVLWGRRCDGGCGRLERRLKSKYETVILGKKVVFCMDCIPKEYLENRAKEPPNIQEMVRAIETLSGTILG